MGKVINVRAMQASTPGATRKPSLYRRDPFRLFFPLGIVLSWVGVGHWLLYALGFSSTYSCELHGLVQMQGFMMAFAIGFLLTALPRRTQSEPATSAELAALATALIWTTVCGVAERWDLAELGYGALFFILARFALGRLAGSGAGRRPPAAFVLIPIAVTIALSGAAAIAAEAGDWAPRWSYGFGQLLVEQGVFLCLVIGVGNLILPIIDGKPPPPDLDASPAERRKVASFAALGGAIFLSLVLEQLGWPTLAPILRALIVAVALAPMALRPPERAGLHRRMVWVSVWMIPLGLIASGLVPDYRVAALHMIFIGGFGTMALSIASHVAMGHLGLGNLGLGRPWPIVAIAVTFSLALLARLAADASQTYFAHLAWAAASWIVGTALWLSYFGPKMLRSN